MIVRNMSRGLANAPSSRQGIEIGKDCDSFSSLSAQVRELSSEVDELAFRLSCIDGDQSVAGADDLDAMEALAVEAAKKGIKLRHRRAKLFGVGLFGEPGWDILLELYVARAEEYCVTVGNACIAACVPMSSALRWCQTLEDRGIILRYRDATDRRRRFVKLSDPAHEKMTELLLSFVRH